jgi:hypothetical protein
VRDRALGAQGKARGAPCRRPTLATSNAARPRRAEQVPSACRWMRPRSGMPRRTTPAGWHAPARSHPRKRGPCSTLRRVAPSTRSLERDEHLLGCVRCGVCGVGRLVGALAATAPPSLHPSAPDATRIARIDQSFPSSSV